MLKAHPYKSALTAILVGVVSFILANAIPYTNAKRTQHWNTSSHLEFLVALAMWLFIPAVMLFSAIGLVLYGVVTRGDRELPRST